MAKARLLTSSWLQALQPPDSIMAVCHSFCTQITRKIPGCLINPTEHFIFCLLQAFQEKVKPEQLQGKGVGQGPTR